MIDVVVAVQNALAREGLRACLDGSGVARVVDAVDGPDEVLSVVNRARPEVLILDVAFRRRRPRLLPTLARERPECAVVVLSRHRPEECVVLGLLRTESGVRLSPEAIDRKSVV